MRRPGSIRNGTTETVVQYLPEDVDLQGFLKLQPALGEGSAPPETVSGVIALFASEDGAFITDTEIRIDGGTHQ